MTEGEALYQSILENPEDDAPRLIYSDWLEEQGDIQRASFIRVQCQLARSEPDSPLYCKLLLKSKRLYKPIWSQTLRGKILHAELHRGFIHKVTMFSKRFVTDASEIFETEPVREVKFADYSAVRGNVPVSTLALCPGLKRLTGINLTGYAVTGRMLDVLLDGGNLQGLDKLELNFTSIESGMLRQIFNSNRLPNLKELSFHYPSDDENWFQSLAESNLIGQLESFSFGGDSNSPDDINEFLSNNAFANLRRFELNSNFMEPILSIIAAKDHFKGLIDLSVANVEDRSFVDFASNSAFDQLRRLKLHASQITDFGVQALLRAEHLRKLYYLGLDADRIVNKSHLKELLRKHCPQAVITFD